MWVKVCGITSNRELKDAISLGPDALGFVVGAERSKRNLSLKKAKKLMKLVPPSISTVAVTLHADNVRGIDKTAEYIQLYEDSFSSFNCGIIRGYLYNEFRVESFEKIENEVDMILVDSGYGTGKVHDWTVTKKIKDKVSKPLVLAGGLCHGNVARAILEVTPYGVDVSSGVENNGRKEYYLMKKFIEKARGV
ncbi:MAG: phosphoribosylanthranilate isomerase [Euryarchaeota archaeon]|nr:phosphoribosylanthranilate isomerase [Euryarchaeota archaeon]